MSEVGVSGMWQVKARPETVLYSKFIEFCMPAAVEEAALAEGVARGANTDGFDVDKEHDEMVAQVQVGDCWCCGWVSVGSVGARAGKTIRASSFLLPLPWVG